MKTFFKKLGLKLLLIAEWLKIIDILSWLNNYRKNMGYMLLPLSEVPHDKQVHGAGGYWIGGVTFSLIFNYLKLDLIWILMITQAICLFIGYVIEFYQLIFNKGHFENQDALYVMHGGTIASYALILILGAQLIF